MVKLFDFINSISITGELTPRIQDAVLSFGELLALIIIDKYLDEKNIKHKCIDSTSIIVSDNNFLKAKPLLKETGDNVIKFLLPELNDNQIIITQGFVARSVDGDITTMGMESSNLTATLLACILKSDKLTLWTDVEGIRSADPKFISDTKLIKNLSFTDAYVSAENGLKLIYPSMIDIAEENNLELIYKSAFNSQGGSTLINNGKSTDYPIINSQQNLKYIKISARSFKSNIKWKNFFDNLMNFQSDIVELQYKSDSIILIISNRINLKEILKNIEYTIIDNCSLITLSNLNLAQIKDIYQFSSDNIKDLIITNQSENSYCFVVNLSL